MMVSSHVVLTLIFAGILYPFIGWNSLIVFLSGFLFDVDHYLYYLVKKKDWSLKNAYLYSFPGTSVYEKHRDALHIFHTWEFWSLLLIGVLFSKIFLFVFLGLVFHMLLDGIDLIRTGEGLRVRAWSLIGWIRRN